MNNTRSTGKSGIETSNTAEESRDPGRDSPDARCYEAQKQARYAIEGCDQLDAAAGQRAKEELDKALDHLGNAKEALDDYRASLQEASD